MANNITCPNCGNAFDAGTVLSAEFENKYKQEYQVKLRESISGMESEKKQLLEEQQKFEEKKKKENELFTEKLKTEKQKLEAEVREQLNRSITADFENKLKILEQSNKQNEDKLKEAREKEFEFLKKEQELKLKESELDINIQKKLQDEREALSEQIRKQEAERNAIRENEHLMKQKEMEIQLEAQKKLVEELKKRTEQGSMQIQGEAQELLLENILHENFPFDLVEEVGKGSIGADCIQVVRNNAGKECGRIIYESKRTKQWSNSWIDKLKGDMRSKSADVAILVTECFPKDMNRFGDKDGVWVCSYEELPSVAAVLRNSLMVIADVRVSEDNKEGKKDMLYNYMTSNEFKQQWDTIIEAYFSLKVSVEKERMQMEKIWKEREKQLLKIMKGATSFIGSVKGIGGLEMKEIGLLDNAGEEEI